jgi:hypothetical protein
MILHKRTESITDLESNSSAEVSHALVINAISVKMRDSLGNSLCSAQSNSGGNRAKVGSIRGQ